MSNSTQKRSAASYLRNPTVSHRVVSGVDLSPILEGNQSIITSPCESTMIEACNSLADLVDPEPERTCYDTDCAPETFTCSKCGEMTRWTLYWVTLENGCKTVRSHKPTFCSNCGAKVVEK